MPPRIVLRTARPGDEAALGRAGFRAFRMGSAEGWTAYFTDNPHAPPEATLLAEVDGALAGHATALDLTMSLAGVDVPMRGIAGVGVLAEHRRSGIGDQLMRAHLVRMRRRGEALSLLYPFEHAYYRAFGYGLVEWFDRVRAAPALLPASPLRRAVRTFDVERHGEAVKASYERSRAGTTGLLVRTDHWWANRVWKRAGEGVVYVEPRSGRIRGALLYDVPADPGYPRQEVRVSDFVAEDADARRGLLGFLQALGAQFRELDLALPFGEAPLILTDKPHLPVAGRSGPVEPIALTCDGAMARLVDVPGAFALHPGPARSGARGRIGLDLADPIFAAQRGAFDVTFGARGARIERGRGARDRLALGVDRLAQVYFAAATATQLLAQGAATGSPRAAALLDRAFAGPRTYLGPANFF